MCPDDCLDMQILRDVPRRVRVHVFPLDDQLVAMAHAVLVLFMAVSDAPHQEGADGLEIHRMRIAL